MKTKYILIIGLLIAITSCNSGIDQNAKQNNSPQPAGSLTNLAATNAAVPVNTIDTNKPTSTPAKPANVALNPAHGQPGHRCDITEGAPLSNTVPNNTLPSLQTSTIPATVQPQNPIINNSQPQLTLPTPKATAGLNPAHGQPGHRCDLTVGAPLSTAATNNATPKTNTPAIQPQNPIIYNPQPPLTAPTSKETAGVNPAHGQPGHKCDLTVGAPLTSKATSSAIPPVTSSTTPANSKTTLDKVSSSPAPLQVTPIQPIQSVPLDVSLPKSTGTSVQNSKVRLNPAHGQPGHVCTIQAGKPLKQ